MSNSITAPETSQRLTIDTLIRRELKVGDPNDPQLIARALAERYRGDVRAQTIEGESKGLPLLQTQIMRQPEVATPTANDIDLAQARHDVQTDLQQLLSDGRTKDIRPELEGWQSVIQRSIDEGVAAARGGLDPSRRDKAFAMRRQLGDYARLARMIGALTPALNSNFRGLATSLDGAASMMLVLMGESMANVGFSGGRFLLQAPFAELQARRDAVLNALRLVGGVVSSGSGGWPRGMRDFRHLNTALNNGGQGDLRVLMNESELARTMDELLQLASGGTSYGLRAVGVTAWAPLSRLHRFVQTTLRTAMATSPELATLHEALILFLDGFVISGGFRMLRVARPAVLNYGFYDSGKTEKAERRLIKLVNRRGTLARQLDCQSQCLCDENSALTQIVLDKILCGLDRAIDYYCVGDEDLGVPEIRAAALRYLIGVVVDKSKRPPPISVSAPLAKNLVAVNELLRMRTRAAKALNGDDVAQVQHDELFLQRQTDVAWRPVVEQMTSGCTTANRVFDDCLAVLYDKALADAGKAGRVTNPDVYEPPIPLSIEESLSKLLRKNS